MQPSGAVVILAAGLGTRLGGPKANMPFGKSTFLQCCLDKLSGLDFLFSAVVVNSAVMDAIRNDLPSRFQLIVNPEPLTGQLSSLRLALRAGADRFPWTLVMLVDLPAVSTKTVHSLVTKAEQKPENFWVPCFKGRRGHPTIYCRAMYSDLLEGPSDQGARWAVQQHSGRRREIKVDDPYILRDIDTPQDYQEISGKVHRETQQN